MTTITEDYVSFETAKLLKEKGFDEATNRYYNAQYDQIRTVSDTFLWHWNNEKFMERVLMDGAIAIPTLQMAMKWLREVHKLHIEILASYHFRIFDGYSFEVYNIKDAEFVNYSSDKGTFKTYEEATEAAIKYCLENLI